MKPDNNSNHKLLITAGILLGLGQAGFFDGIVFHQLLQWHHMFTNIEGTDTVSGLELNTLGDGLFHLADWLFTLARISSSLVSSYKEEGRIIHLCFYRRILHWRGFI